MRHDIRTIARTMTAVAGVAIVSACAGKNRSTAAVPEPTTWVAVACSSCEPASVDVHVRRSVDQSGKSGEYTYARVRNRNAHPVALTLDLVPDSPPLHDNYIPSESFRVTLQAAGDEKAESVVMLRTRGVTEASVHTVEKY